MILRWWGVTVPPGVEIGSHCHFDTPHIRIGAHCFINRDVELCSSADGPIELGEYVALGTGTMLITVHHEVGGPTQRAGPFYGKGIVIGDGCWLASRVVVLPGVTIGDGCVIAAGSVVTRDCAPNGVYAGAPARRIRDLTDESQGAVSTAV
jgi:maltose O-acetyltransferase